MRANDRRLRYVCPACGGGGGFLIVTESRSVRRVREDGSEDPGSYWSERKRVRFQCVGCGHENWESAFMEIGEAV